MSEPSNEIAVVFDRATGRVLGTHAVYDAETRSYRPPTLEETRGVYRAMLAGGEADRFDVVHAPQSIQRGEPLRFVDPKTRKIPPPRQLRIDPPRAQVVGDGEQSLEFTVTVVGEGGRAAGDFAGELRIITTHGRLSEPGGKVSARKGSARIKLTSTAETIERVTVTASDPSGRCAPASADVEFL
jgi:hypothetical protein